MIFPSSTSKNWVSLILVLQDDFLDPDLETKDSTMETEVKATVGLLGVHAYPSLNPNLVVLPQTMQHHSFRSKRKNVTRRFQFEQQSGSQSMFETFRYDIEYLSSGRACALHATAQIGKEYAALLKWRQVQLPRGSVKFLEVGIDRPGKPGNPLVNHQLLFIFYSYLFIAVPYFPHESCHNLGVSG
jgi:hypothetical protein